MQETSLRRALIEAVKNELVAQGLNQADLAFVVGLSEKHLSQMLTGRVQGSLSAWEAILDYLDIPVQIGTPQT